MKSVENVLPTCCVGDSGVTSSGCSSSMASSSRHSSSNCAVGQHRRIEHVVAEPVAGDLLGQPGVPLTDGFWAHGARLPSRTDILVVNPRLTIERQLRVDA